MSIHECNTINRCTYIRRCSQTCLVEYLKGYIKSVLLIRGTYNQYWLTYRLAGNFREVYISRLSQFDQIYECLSCEFVNITIQTHNTSIQIAKLIPRNVCSSATSRNFMPRIFSAIR